MNLNRTPDPLDRNARNKENDNWDKIEGNISQIKGTIDDLVLHSGGDSNLEVVQARGGKSTLNARLDDFTSQLNDKATKSELNQKADKSYVDDLFSNLDGLEIKGGFDTLSELDIAYPSGTEGLYVVDNNLYAWNGNEWKVVKELEVTPWADFMTTENEEWVI